MGHPQSWPLSATHCSLTSQVWTSLKARQRFQMAGPALRNTEWVTGRLKERASIWKQERLYNQERRQLRTRGGRNEGGDSSSDGAMVAAARASSARRKRRRRGRATRRQAPPSMAPARPNERGLRQVSRWGLRPWACCDNSGGCMA